MDASTHQLRQLLAIQTEIVTSGLDLNAIMQLVCERAEQLTAADAAVIELVDGDSFVYRAATRLAQPLLGQRSPIIGGLSGQAVLERTIQRSDNSQADPRVAALAAQLGIGSMLAIPLIVDDRVDGVLAVYSGHQQAFSDDDAEQLRLLSAVIAAQLAHASLFQAAETAALIDPVTGGANRRAYDQAIAGVGDSAQVHTLCLIDLDNFKTINDTYGHPLGDSVLRQVAELLDHAFRRDDHVFRLGGDEFALIICDARPEEVDQAMARLAEQLRTSSIGYGQLDFSYGSTLINDDPYQAHQEADRLLYLDKRARQAQR